MKPIKAWAIVADGKILEYGQYPHLYIFNRYTQAEQAVFFMQRDSLEKYDMKMVRVEITILKKVIPK